MIFRIRVLVSVVVLLSMVVSKPKYGSDFHIVHHIFFSVSLQKYKKLIQGIYCNILYTYSMFESLYFISAIFTRHNEFYVETPSEYHCIVL